MTTHIPKWDYSNPATGLSLPAPYFFDQGVFDAEKQNPEEMQQSGWHAILDNFKKYVEGM